MTTLIIDPGCGYVTVVDLDRGTERSVLTPHLAGGDFPFDLVDLGNRLVMDGGDAAYVSPADLSAPAASIGHATYFVLSGREDRVWLVTQGSDNVVQQVDLAGHVIVSSRHLPRLASPLRGVGERLIVEEGAQDSLWDPATGRFSGPFGPAAVLDVHGKVVAWRQLGACTSPPCPLHLLDTDTGRDRLVRPPPGFAEFSFSGAFSPDGTRLALFVLLPNAQNGARLALLDAATGLVTIIPGYDGDSVYSRVAWSASGQWLFFDSNGGLRVGAYDPSRSVGGLLPPLGVPRRFVAVAG